LTVLTYVTLANSNSVLPEDGDYTKPCWSCFNMNFNIPFKKNLCSSWCKNTDNIKRTVWLRKKMPLRFEDKKLKNIINYTSPVF